MSRASDRGFTLVEMVIVLAVLAVLISLSLLKYMDIRRTALTATAVHDIRAVHTAALNYFADHEAWPDESGVGQVPTGLDGLLPAGLSLSLDRRQYALDYENIMIDGIPLIGVAVTTSDPRLWAKLTNSFSDYPFFLNGDKLTYLIAGPGGVF